MRPEGLSQRKIPMTPLGIEPATFQLVALYLYDLGVKYILMTLSQPHVVPKAWQISGLVL